MATVPVALNPLTEVRSSLRQKIASALNKAHKTFAKYHFLKCPLFRWRVKHGLERPFKTGMSDALSHLHLPCAPTPTQSV